MKEIKTRTTVEIEYGNLPEEIRDELVDYLDGVGHDDIPFNLSWENWKDSEFYCLPLLSSHLLQIYGEDITKYEDFILITG